MTTSFLRSAHVGVGNRGAEILKMAMQYGCEPTVLVDTNPELLAAARERAHLPASACFDDLHEALKTPGLQACIITSPAQFHAHQIRVAIDHGLHVFVAKPLTYDIEEARQLVEAAENRKVILVVDQQSQFMLTERTAAQWMHQQRFGEIGFGSFTIHRCRPEMRSFTSADPFLWEQGVHSFNSLLAILGRQATAVTAHQFQPSWSAYNGATVSMGMLEFEGGLPVQYLGTFDSRQFEIDIRFECEKAAIRIHATSWQKELLVARPGAAFESTGIRDDQESDPPERFSFENFHKAIATGKRVPNDGRDNLRTLAIVDAFIRSAKSGRTVQVTRYD